MRIDRMKSRSLILNKIYNEDCLDGMNRIPDGSVDMILCDLPFGVLNKGNVHAKWDVAIPFEPLWKHYQRIIKENGAIVLFSQGAFTARLVNSNEKMWRYNLVWKKGSSVRGFLNANRMPLRNHEDICIFYKKLPTYNPIMSIGRTHSRGHSKGMNRCYGSFVRKSSIITNENFPLSVIDISPVTSNFLHPTQKPVKLLSYLIRTYTNPGETVLDNCIGSGSTAIACIETDRNYIGFELSKDYYDISIDRISNHEKVLSNISDCVR